MALSNVAQITLTLGVAAVLFAGTVGLHVAWMPRGSLATIQTMSRGRQWGMWAFLYAAFFAWLFSVMFFRLHRPLNRTLVERICGVSVVALAVAFAELFTFAASSRIYPPIQESGAFIWLAVLVIGTVTGATMLWTLAEATKQRRTQESTKARDYIDHAETALHKAEAS